MRVDWQIHRSFVYGSWEPEVVGMIKQQVTAGMRVLDLGAQSGFYSLLFSKLVGPQGSVIAFEPLPANYRLLRRIWN
jgi:tRNA A58 N-methylase Trm61